VKIQLIRSINSINFKVCPGVDVYDDDDDDVENISSSECDSNDDNVSVMAKVVTCSNLRGAMLTADDDCCT